MGKKPDLGRIYARHDPALWDDLDLLTLPEAAELLWPTGPLKAASLRVAARDGQLAVTVIAGKMMTTKAALKQMGVCAPRIGISKSRLDEPLSSNTIISHIVDAAGSGKRSGCDTYQRD